MVTDNLTKNTPRGYKRGDKETLRQFLLRILKDKLKSLKYTL